MRAKTVILLALFLMVATAGTFWGLYFHGVEHFLGIDTQQSDNYDFVSGVGPIIVTALGYSGIIATLLSHLNCHEPGCWAIGRHKVNGTPWCNVHHENARPELSEAELLEQVLAELQLLNATLRGGSDTP